MEGGIKFVSYRLLPGTTQTIADINLFRLYECHVTDNRTQLAITQADEKVKRYIIRYACQAEVVKLESAVEAAKDEVTFFRAM